ncbi:hypothetical protein [Psychrobacter sp. FDAARGOS_221]|uniref:hypothetical protein n=1 Tax=Psychrobacter sp. FDAARGOS_221 TaxID=1975705 RepID=UPI000BB52FCC|nr:hypothetical protein [Psychrobacter sp. FDAARGOS_221]PNK59858.1 hypothetical protein A6J60_002490 [Psychrobacter sp. FDAARGOS_221]
MTIINIIISKQQAEFLPKERYLKFVEYVKIQNFFAYIRYDYTQSMFASLDNQYYQLSESGLSLLKKLTSLDNNEAYWSVMHLKNKMGEKEACDNALRLITNKDYIQADFNQKLSLSYDIIYKL